MWTYKHEIGVIHIEGWGNPFLVVTENKYWQGQSWGYNYYKLGVSFPDIDSAQAEARKLNARYNLPSMFYIPEHSEAFLLSLADKFTESEIRKVAPTQTVSNCLRK